MINTLSRVGVKRTFFVVLILISMVLILELCFRQYLFSSLSNGSPLKRPGLYADPQSEDDYWVLRIDVDKCITDIHNT